jgi:hypothetical protein
MVVRDRLVLIRRQFRQAKRSAFPVYDFTQLVYAYLFRPFNKFITSKVTFINKGIFRTEGPFYFGIISNKMGSVTSDRGLLKIAKTGTLIIGKDVKISSGCKIHVNGEVNIGSNTYIMPHTFMAINQSLKLVKNVLFHGTARLWIMMATIFLLMVTRNLQLLL